MEILLGTDLACANLAESVATIFIKFGINISEHLSFWLANFACEGDLARSHGSGECGRPGYILCKNIHDRVGDGIVYTHILLHAYGGPQSVEVAKGNYRRT
eukprot:3068205-Pleurochrysis_carterae.AAC.1